jgi:hypothetical protein
MPKPSFRRWLRAWALAVAVAAIVTALATGAYVVSQAQIMGFGTPTPFAEKPLSLMARQFAGGLLWGGAAGCLFAVPGVAVALGVITLWWDTFATTPWWIWTLLGAGLGVMLALPIFGAASGFFAEMVAAAAGAAALLFARQQLRVVPNTLHPPR